MTHVISLATASHLALARRLAVSLAKRHPDWTLTLYCEDQDAAARTLGVGPWRCRHLPSIAVVGAKRAKFDAYADAIMQGAFVWLDADVIVLDSLEELVARPDDALVACPDDLSECDFIADPRHPWPATPSLRADVYFNSGVFAAGAGLASFLRECQSAARDATQWAAWTIAGRLLDNHFLCAMVNRERIPVRELDARRYNWQGLRRRDRPMIRVVEGRLSNRETGLPLHLAHFAGVADVDAWLKALPPAELAYLARTIGSERDDLLAALGSLSVAASTGDEAVKAGFMFARPHWLAQGGGTDASAPEARTVLSFVRCIPASDVRWNGLPCGGAYLDASEYAFLRDVVLAAGVRTVVEVGAGYTSVLFRRCGADVVSIEAHSGPWIEVARAAGACVRVVAFDRSAEQFEAQALADALPMAAGQRTVDLLFVDSPNGTRNRRHVLAQLGERIAPRLVVFHDAHRDAELVFAACLDGWQVLRYLPTWRGIVVLQRTAQPAPGLPVAREDAGPVPDVTVTVAATGAGTVLCRIRNIGSDTMSASGTSEWRLSYHLESRAPGGERCWDNPRFPLPCGLVPGDEIELPVAIAEVSGAWDCWFDFVQEGVRWLSEQRPQLRAATIRVGERAGSRA